MSKVSSHIVTVTPVNNPTDAPFSSASQALAHNGYIDTEQQFVARRFGVRTGTAYAIIERESDGALFAVRGTNQDRSIRISRFTGTRQELE